MNKEVLFAKTLEQVRKTAKEQGNCISEEQVKDAFAELDLSGEQLQMVFDYLLKHKIGIGQPMDPDEFLTDEEKDYLQEYLKKRKNDSPEESYTARLISRGINKVAQKVGEEAVELVIEAKDNNEILFLNEAADLMYHYLVLLIAKGYGLEEVIAVLRERHK